MESSTASGPIKVGVITDQTGALSFMGIANANVARMVIDDINEQGGLLGRQLELHLEDSATEDSAAAAAATKLVQDEQVDVVFGGIYSSSRQAIKGPAVVEGKRLYIYPEQYEGQESDPLIFCTGPVPAQQIEPLMPWLMERTGAKTFFLPGSDYIWPHVLNEKVREVVTAGFLEQLHGAGFTGRGGQLVCTYFDENLLDLIPNEQTEGLYGCLDYYQAIEDPFSKTLLDRYNELYPGAEKFTGGSACSGMYRGLKLWEGAVTEAGSLDQESVINALDHATISEGPGGPAEMVAGQHHVRMNMYIGQASDGVFKVVNDLGAIDPKERVVG